MSTPSDKQDASQPIKKKRAYRPYSEEALIIGLKEILNGDLSIRKVVAKSGIPKSTLIKKIKLFKSGNMSCALQPVGKYSVLSIQEEFMLTKQDTKLTENQVMASVLPSIGKGLEVPTQEVIMSAEPDTEICKVRQDIILSTKEETMFIKHAMLLTEALFRVSREEFRTWVKIYLDQKEVQKGGDNLPGEIWMDRFLMKYPKLCSYLELANQPLSMDIDSSIINRRVEYLESQLASISKYNIWNYVEAGIKKYSYGFNVQLHGKGKVLLANEKKVKITPYSITLCGNAMGQLLPPYVIRRGDSSQNLASASYHSDSFSSTGWMDFSCFEDYLYLQLFPRLAELPGPHYFLGMNDSVYLTPSIEEACRLRDITFLCSSEMSQPLEVLLEAVEYSWPDQEEMMKKLEALEECQERHFKNLGISPFHANSLLKNYWEFGNALDHNYLSIEKP